MWSIFLAIVFSGGATYYIYVDLALEYRIKKNIHFLIHLNLNLWDKDAHDTHKVQTMYPIQNLLFLDALASQSFFPWSFEL